MSTTLTRHLEVIERLDAGERLDDDGARALLGSRDVVAVVVAVPSAGGEVVRQWSPQAPHVIENGHRGTEVLTKKGPGGPRRWIMALWRVLTKTGPAGP